MEKDQIPEISMAEQGLRIELEKLILTRRLCVAAWSAAGRQSTRIGSASEQYYRRRSSWEKGGSLQALKASIQRQQHIGKDSTSQWDGSQHAQRGENREEAGMVIMTDRHENNISRISGDEKLAGNPWAWGLAIVISYPFGVL